MNIIKPEIIHDIYNGVPEGEKVKAYTKKYHEVLSLYENELENEDPIVYEVYSYTKGNEDVLGNLNWGLTVMKPLTIKGECNMTKGHFHNNKDCAEIYFGIDGEGLLLLMDETGYTWAENVFKGSLHHIDGHVAHRLVNTGDSELKVGACWPTAAGHDYDSIINHEFAYRIFKENGKIKFIER